MYLINMTLREYVMDFCLLRWETMNDINDNRRAFEFRKMYTLNWASALPVVIMLLLVALYFLLSVKEESVHDKVMRHRHVASFMSTKNLTHRLAMRARPNT